MHPATLVTLNMRELDRLKVIQAVVDRVLKPGRAAERLGLTVRQIERLVIRYHESGAAGLVSRKRGRPGNRRRRPAKARASARRFRLECRGSRRRQAPCVRPRPRSRPAPATGTLKACMTG